MTFSKWCLDFTSNGNMTFSEWCLDFTSNRNMTFSKWCLDFTSNRNMTFSKWCVFFFLKLPKEIWPFQSESWFYFHCLWKLSNCSVSYVKGNYFFILKLQLFGTLFQIVNGANNLVCIVSVRNRVAMLDRICLTWWLLVLECEKAN